MIVDRDDVTAGFGRMTDENENQESKRVVMNMKKT
jgi:hypothetical protein